MVKHRDGSTYDHEQDGQRLSKQHRDVLAVMLPGKSFTGPWVTLAGIEALTGHPQASISARLRDFRKPRFGGYLVERRRRGGKGGTWEYRVSRPD